MKNVMKSFGLGGLYLVLSYCIYRMVLGVAAIFKDIGQAVGFGAVFLFILGIILAALCILSIFLMGAIPVYTQKKEDKND